MLTAVLTKQDSASMPQAGTGCMMTDKQPLIYHIGPGLTVSQRVHLQVRMPKSFFPNATYMKLET